MAASSPKAALRKRLRQQRQALSPFERAKHAQAITERALQLPELESSQHIGCYLSDDGEVDTQALIECLWQLGKNCYLPMVDPKQPQQMCFGLYQAEQALISNRFGILEPDPAHTQCIAASDLDLVFIPLVAFDKQGHRLGRGGGYYDKTFAFVKHKPLLVGLAYHWQQQPELKVDHWDVQLHRALTDKQTLHCEKTA